jgi:hypothetical protein
LSKKVLKKRCQKINIEFFEKQQRKRMGRRRIVFARPGADYVAPGKN